MDFIKRRKNFMNLKKNILIAGLLCTFGVVGASSLALSSNFDSKVAKADSTTTMYVEVCDAWYSGVECVVEVYASKGAAWSWIDASNGNVLKLKDNLWQVTIPTDTDEFIIDRKDPSNARNQSWTGSYNQTANITYDSQKNYYHVTSLNGNDCPYESGWMNKFTGSTPFYATMYNKNYDWFDNSAATTIRFWDGTEIRGFTFGTGSSTICFSPIGSVGEPVYAAGFNIFRKSSDLSETWSQTGNWSFTYANKDMNAFVVEATTGDATFYSGGSQTMDTDAYRAMAFGIHFLNKTDGICADNGDDNNSSDLSAIWSSLSSVATTLIGTDERKTTFKTSDEAFTENAFNRYAHIVGRYESLADFIGDVRVSSSPLAIISSNMNNATLILVLVGVLALAASGSFFFIRRRKLEK